MFQATPLRFSPGAGWAYSSPAYVLLAHIVEQVAGAPYAVFLQRAIFSPLGLADTGAGNRSPHPERQARGYVGKRPEPSFDLDTVNIGPGDIWSTTGDLARWDAALTVPGRLLSADSLQAMFTPYAAVSQEFADIPGAFYGYGWCLAEISGRRVRFHPGDNAGFAALNIYLPDQEATIIVLSNDEDNDIEDISRRLMNELDKLLDGGEKG